MKNNKTILIVVVIIVLLLVVGYFTNWFGMKKPVVKAQIDSYMTPEKRLIDIIKNNQSMISCPTGCILSLNTSGASGTVSQGNNTYTCRCSDGSTTTPILS